ncbi:hypothetical protein KAFR_0F02640 [Kazachstania africana CBS 2517]|uniref:Cytochrome c oxidase subunit n=1 Tax=Kazachstania africana (strain ATCC 22294 / BCRC 22015 / CBS 2517 / CECT 1963 / NBRC 1671 / NRRL Y-8276) TaxID=1071382 RepID=H2AWW1_KAZAF|nr:hypothetical protein KAFR_0F02640 [Kazachstania africana CBS 2517]CCF58861.1 hypothetical protein KAFR_0F02640 [Kazachstania africana CBS 2517]
MSEESQETQGDSPLHTVGFDARFPNQNQTKHCWQAYVDYHKCINLKGEDFAPCKTFWRTYSSLCPVDWIEKWDDQREKGVFAGDINP